jgi:hypothetical protein
MSSPFLAPAFVAGPAYDKPEPGFGHPNPGAKVCFGAGSHALGRVSRGRAGCRFDTHPVMANMNAVSASMVVWPIISGSP